MREMEIAKAGHEFMTIVDRVRDLKRRGYKDGEIEQVLDGHEKSTVRLASKFLQEVILAKLGKACILCALLGSLSACLPAIGEMPATGWRVSFGVDPIDGLRDERRLDQVKPSIKQVKY